MLYVGLFETTHVSLAWPMRLLTIHTFAPGIPDSVVLSNINDLFIFESSKENVFFLPFLVLVHCSNSLFNFILNFFFCNVCFLRKKNKMYLDFKEKTRTLSNVSCLWLV